MRLRNIKGAEEAVASSIYCIKDPSSHKGNWKSFFSNTHPIHLEIGMGKGQFLMNLAKNNPQINYIGIEKYTSVLFRALQKMDEEPLPNIHFLCIDATILPDLFQQGEVDRIYLNFSDPWPKDRHEKRRLTSVEFMDRYDQILAVDGQLEFKTDNQILFDFSLQSIPMAKWYIDSFSRDLHKDSTMNSENIMTEYEEKFSAKGNPIYKLIAKRSF